MNQKTNNIISVFCLILMVSFFFFLVTIKSSDENINFLISVIPTGFLGVFLLYISSENNKPFPNIVTILFMFLIFAGNAYQSVIMVNSSIKTFSINTISTIIAIGVFIGYVRFLKKKILINKKGYHISIIVTLSTILFCFLFLILFGTIMHGAKLWISIGSETIQLSEIIKLLFFVLLALTYSSNISVRLKIIYSVGSLGLCSVFFAILNEFGTTIILLFVFLLSFYIHIRSKYSAILLIGTIVLIATLLVIIFQTHSSTVNSNGVFSLQLNKIYDRLTIADNSQFERALQGMVNGGFFGADPSKYVIEVFAIESDFALSGISQYFGIIIMILCSVTPCIILYMVYKAGNDNNLNVTSRYKFSFILMAAISAQAILSMCGNIGLAVSGVGFPLLSSGGTQSIVLFIEICFIVYGMREKKEISLKIKKTKQKKGGYFYV